MSLSGDPQQAALGLIETIGLAAGIEAADSMVKAANVEIVTRQQVGGGLVAILVRGDTGAVKAAIDAATIAASKVGRVVSAHMIPRPDPAIESILRRKFVR
jgi:ethanolamine utilization protein EutM